MRNILPLLSVSTLGLLASMLAPAAPASADDSRADPTTQAISPLRAEGFKVVETGKLYRVQQRPWSHIPTGARLLVRAPDGVTAADLHRAAASDTTAGSPLAVPGAKVNVVRRGDLYELQVTAEQRSAALEIQHRAASL